MGGDREGAGGRGPRPPPGKLQVVMYFLEEKLVRTSIEKQSPPPPCLTVDCRIFYYFHFLHVAYFLKLADYADAQADLRLCCLHATKSSFSQQGTYGMGYLKQTLLRCRDHLKCLFCSNAKLCGIITQI